MNNMAHKKRQWRRWEKHVKRCLASGQRKGTAGIRKYGRQRTLFHNRRVERNNRGVAEFMAMVTGMSFDEAWAELQTFVATADAEQPVGG